MTVKDFDKLVKNLIRSNVQENFIDNINSSDLENAKIMMMSKINIYKPVTNYTLEALLDAENVNVWASTLAYGTAYYTLTHQVSEWLHNGMDVQIEDFTLENKMGDYTTVADRFKEEFESNIAMFKDNIFFSKLKIISKSSLGGITKSSRTSRASMYRYASRT